MVSYRRLAGPIIGASVLILLFLATDPTKIVGYLSHVDPVYLVFAALTEIVGGFLYSFAWFVILKPSGVKISFRQTYLITMGSLFLIYTTPTGVAAEAARIAMVRKHAQGDVGAPAASVIIHRVIYALGFVSVAGVATLLVYGALSGSPFLHTVVVAFATTLVIVILVLALVARAKGFRGVVKRLAGKLAPIVSKITGSKEALDLSSVDRAFDTFEGAVNRMRRSPLRLITSYLVIAVRWTLVSVVALLVMYSIGYHGISIWAIMVVMMIAEIVSTTPIGVPG
ncbi:MAG: lysylphosphatidylglycerol synthase transmembrane domain-containing protein, partial [Thermoprotei archaeon]